MRTSSQQVSIKLSLAAEQCSLNAVGLACDKVVFGGSSNSIQVTYKDKDLALAFPKERNRQLPFLFVFVGGGVGVPREAVLVHEAHSKQERPLAASLTWIWARN